MSTSRLPPFRIGFSLALIALAFLASACATTRQTRSVEPQGFLGDYSLLQEGEGDQAQLRYVNEAAQWAQYDSIQLDMVTLWHDPETKDIDPEDAQRLTDRFYSALHEQLSGDYKMVDQPGPGVLRVRAAITEARGSKVVMNAVTTLVPQLRLLSTLGGFVTGAAIFVGKAGVEVDVRDAMTDERLAAAVSERVGTKTYRGGFRKWSHVDRAFDTWAEGLRNFLAEQRNPTEGS